MAGHVAHQKTLVEFKTELTQTPNPFTDDPLASFPDIPQLANDCLYVTLRVNIVMQS